MGSLGQLMTQRSNSTDVQRLGRLLMSNVLHISGPTVTIGSGSCDVQHLLWNVTDLGLNQRPKPQ